MSAGILLLGLAYVLSQFFRAFLAVLTTLLQRDIGATPDDLAFASGLWSRISRMRGRESSPPDR